MTYVQTTFQQSITTHTWSRLDPGEYTGLTNAQGAREGLGECKWSDGSTYNGEWKDNVRHGKGVFKSREGTVHDGIFDNDIRHGPGVMTYESGNTVTGTWEKDRLNGPGQMKNKGKPAVQFKMYI